MTAARLIGAFDRAVYACLPGLVVLAGILLMAAPMPVASRWVPDIALMLVYLAAAFRLPAFPVWLCFLLGLVRDLLAAGPPGVGILMFLAAHALAASQGRFLAMTALLWVGFFIVAVITALGHWGIVLVVHGAWIDPSPLVVNTAMTMLVFPLLAQPFKVLLMGGADAQQRP